MDDTGYGTEERRKERSRRFGLVGTLVSAAAIAAACSDSTGPDEQIPPADQMCPSVQVEFCSNADAAAAARDGTADAGSRSVAALENASGRAALAASLGKLDAALAARNITKARVALNESRSALAAAAGERGDAPDLAAIELLLDYVGPLIGS